MSDDTTSSTPAKASKAKLGETVKAAEVTRPDGNTDRVGGGAYVLDTVGDYYVDGAKVTVS